MLRKSAAAVLVLALITLVWIAPSESASPPQDAVLLGQLLDGRSGDPLSHTQVLVEGTALATLSGADGTFILERVPAGEYQILFSRSCYYPTRVEVTVPESSPRPILLRLALPLAGRESADGSCLRQFAPS